MRTQKQYTIKEWKKLYNLQELLCKKYDIILSDHKTKKESVLSILDQINFKNINKSIISFNKMIQEFGGSMEKLTTELDKSSKNNIKIWSDIPQSNSKAQQKSKDQLNLEKFWGNY
jgi:hypothetical protein